MDCTHKGFLKAHPARVEFHDEEKMWPHNTVPKEGRGTGYIVPIYCAGFFAHPAWIYAYQYKHNRRSLFDVATYIRTHPDAESLAPTLKVHEYFDKGDFALISLHDNLQSNYHNTLSWLARRDEQLDILCMILEISEEQTAIVKRNFAWHMLSPRVRSRVPYNISLYDPNACDEYDQHKEALAKRAAEAEGSSQVNGSNPRAS